MVFGVKISDRRTCFYWPRVLGLAACLVATGCAEENEMSSQQDAAESLDSSDSSASADSSVDVIADGRSPTGVDAAAANVVDAAAHDGASVDATESIDTLVCSPSPTKLECTPEFQHNENTVGLFISAGMPVGWRFEVTGDCPRMLTRMGINIHQGFGSDGTLFGAIVALAANDTQPVDPAAVPGLVLKTVLIPLAPYESGSKTVSAEVSVALVPGWYEVVFGVGAFGATATNATVYSGATTICTDNTYPFTLKTQAMTYILQGIGPHIFVEMK
jgi:hypothetical protein